MKHTLYIEALKEKKCFVRGSLEVKGSIKIKYQKQSHAYILPFEISYFILFCTCSCILLYL